MVNIKNLFGEISTSNENKLFVSGSSLQLEFAFLIFFDSRGLTIENNNYNNAYFYNIMKKLLQKNQSFVAISRPKNMTIFATLYNFLKLNKNLKFQNLITNLGFVDCTPKKTENINDLLMQISQFSQIKNKVTEFEEFQLNDGSFEVLKSINYSLEYKKELINYFDSNFNKLYFINTPIVPNNIKLSRKRPISFFNQLEITNNLISELINLNTTKNRLIDIQEMIYTYDGVHYTEEGHKKIFNKILQEFEI